MVRPSAALNGGGNWAAGLEPGFREEASGWLGTWCRRCGRRDREGESSGFGRRIGVGSWFAACGYRRRERERREGEKRGDSPACRNQSWRIAASEFCGLERLNGEEGFGWVTRGEAYVREACCCGWERRGIAAVGFLSKGSGGIERGNAVHEKSRLRELGGSGEVSLSQPLRDSASGDRGEPSEKSWVVRMPKRRWDSGGTERDRAASLPSPGRNWER